MRVRLLQSATVVLPDIGQHWFGAGEIVDIPDEHFDPATHEKVDAEAVAPVPQTKAEARAQAAQDRSDARAEAKADRDAADGEPSWDHRKGK